jgi:hypothetical protein
MARQTLALGHENWIQQFLEPPTGTQSNDSEVVDPDAIDAYELESVRADYDARIRLLAQLSFDLTTEAEEFIWDAGLYSASPLVAIPLVPTRNDGERKSSELVVLRTYHHRSWVVSYLLDPAEWPRLGAAITEAMAIRHERDQRVGATRESFR